VERWFLGVLGTVVAGVLVYWLNQRFLPHTSLKQPPPLSQKREDVDNTPLEVVDPIKEAERVLADSPAAKLILYAVEFGLFMTQVVREGNAGTTYRREIKGTEYRVTPSEQYIDSRGRTCRDLRMSNLENGQWTNSKNTFRKERGVWKSDLR